MPHPLVTVVIPTLNPGSDLDPQLAALFTQQTDFSFDILIIDSGSRPTQLMGIEEHPVRLIRITQRQFGHGRTRNLAVKACNSPFIAFLTQDALPCPGWLQNLLDAVRHNAQVDAAFSRQLPRSNADRNVAARLAQSFPEGENCSIRFCNPDQWAKLNASEKYRLAQYDHVAALARRKALLARPLPDLHFGEDIAWALETLKAGRAIAYAPQSQVIHSHKRGFLETYKRSKAEHQLLSRLLGFKTVGTPLGLTQASTSILISNFQSLLSLGNNPEAIAGELSRQFAELFGQYFGQREVNDHQAEWIVNKPNGNIDIAD